ncbi:hypothetical protein [Streptomyces sp. NPDC097610]|uniref:hypothetical protein n=1 Tax=Streptomyces sp. NPDC097610 TaxID=3157227 RepID=UPI0033249E92
MPVEGVLSVPGAKTSFMDLEDASSRVRFLIRDSDLKYTAAFDALLTDAASTIVPTGIQMPG